MASIPLGSWLDLPEDPSEALEAECDLVLASSERWRDFPAEDFEADPNLQLGKYFDAEGNCLIVNAQTKQITFMAKV